MQQHKLTLKIVCSLKKAKRPHFGYLYDSIYMKYPEQEIQRQKIDEGFLGLNIVQ